jgi:hypothetical protein
MREPSKRYFEALEATKTFHSNHKAFNGRYIFRYHDEIKQVIDEMGCKTMLDYGCGKGRQWKIPMEETGMMLADFLGVAVTKYDPGWPEYADEPVGKFDIVICTQVLGSIPVIDLPWVIDRLYGFAEKAVFVGETLGPVKKGVHRHMAAEMPHGWTHEQFAEAVRRRSHVRGYLKTNNRVDRSIRFEQL